MSRAATPFRQPQPTAMTALPGLPRRPLSTEQQLAALKRVQDQAEQRLKLGTQFFKAAEARTGEYRQILDQIKAEQETLRGEMQQDISRSFHTYDQWVGEMEEGFTTAIHGLESKIDQLQSEWAKTQQRIDTMMKRSEAMLDQCRSMLDTPPGIPGTPGNTPATLPAPASLSVAARDIPEPVPTLATRPVTAPLVECAPRPAERLHQAPPVLPALSDSPPPVVAAAPIAEAATSGHSIADAIASADADIESPEFYRQVLEKLREQDEMTP